jgi:hypothetical protein
MKDPFKKIIQKQNNLPIVLPIMSGATVPVKIWANSDDVQENTLKQAAIVSRLSLGYEANCTEHRIGSMGCGPFW